MRECQDGRRHGACRKCKQTPDGGEPILVCRQCPGWNLCTGCCSSTAGRLPMLAEDPLFHGPSDPCLLAPFTSMSTQVSHGYGTVIICPGGNYEFLCPTEGMPVAQFLARRGIHAVVLKYRLLPRFCLKDAISDLETAVALIRRTRCGPVAAMGFSAGGHLVASLSLRLAKKDTHWTRRPLDAQVLVYPAIDGKDWLEEDKCGFFHDGSFERAPELQVHNEALLGGPGFAAPPTFLVASTVDGCCPPEEHSDPYSEALKKKRIPCVYLRRNFGDHGFGIHGGWAANCASWLQSRGFGSGRVFAGA